ncbi:MAG TPA: AmmeMemoRadiSam system protein A [Candidatus Hydrogenedentes bacterium]|nr:AmmeMemoRadiSam system protein A [Candidatus Hydrogenedentota bacterium]
MSDIMCPYLTEEEEKLLLQIARDSLQAYVLRGEHLDLDKYPLTDNLREKHGAFVTLRRQGGLRGCIGYTKNVEALAEAVRDNAVNAAVRDPRFTPVTPEELDEIDIEVSALCPGDTPESPYRAINTLDEIVIGRDGLYLELGGSRGGGLLLPQVPVEQGWNRSQFLSALCRKAGAPDRAWEKGAKLYRFCAQVFSEKE